MRLKSRGGSPGEHENGCETDVHPPPKKMVEQVVTHPHMFASVQVTIVPGRS